MKARTLHTIAFVIAAGTLPAVAFSADVAKVDRDFVGKVSQGGRFEVEASELAVNRAVSADVKKFAQDDVADHTKVNDELKGIAAAQNLPLEPTLAKPLQKKLDALGKLTGAAFDKAYISEMAAIHHKDEGIFAKEAKNAASPDWKAFAAKTDEIVKGHIKVLDTIK